MAETRLSHMFSAPMDITRRIREGHEQVLATFYEYRVSSPDSRQALVGQILRQLASQLEMEEHLAFHPRRKSGSAERTLIGTIAEHEAIKAKVIKLQQFEGDDDQAFDEAFEDIMKSVRDLFISEERDLFPLIDHSLDA
jgi:hemerythrin superfamily protein